MNNTNRAANRIFLLIIGLVLIGLGGAVVAAALWPEATDFWTQTGESGQSWFEQAIAATTVGATTLSWVTLGALAMILLVVILLIVALIRTVAGRRSGTVLRSSGAENPLGRITVGESFASDALTHSLGGRDEILSTHVTANQIKRMPVMHVSVTPRQNTSPRQLTEYIDKLVVNLSTLTGQELPTYISIHSNLRARLAKDQRRLS